MPSRDDRQPWNNFTVSSSSWPSLPALRHGKVVIGWIGKTPEIIHAAHLAQKKLFHFPGLFGMLRIISHVPKGTDTLFP